MSATSKIVAPADASSLVNVNMSNVTKLTSTNFLMWKRQVHALCNGYDLAGYLDGSTTAPDATLTTEANTSAEIWSTLTNTYAQPSRGHILQIREQLKQWKKGAKSIEDYFNGFTTRFDQLALLASPIPHEYQIDYILCGLPDEYKQVTDQIAESDTPPSLTVLHEKLINQELKIQTLLTASSSIPASANLASHRGHNTRGPQQSRGNNTMSQPRNQFHSRPISRGRGYQGRCQICGVQVHSARWCSQLQSSGRGYSHSSGGYQAASPPMWQPQANFAATPSYNPTPWILDSGATHHLTSDLSNLSLHQPYNGGEEVKIVDGSGIPITKMGSGEGSQHGGPITPRQD
ncbi:PREDICTED: uncharacterized protein LOC104767861 [Camelina sativa]|uniref:Uncharacterized protein LOC104767861 n=1 Tax=Camelina sativa TaxID=90675 RepID=A0ABM0XS20_CAMSA|nr:PREDICTED: uncharacterized protein LOC104767861 [Camelina sativa]